MNKKNEKFCPDWLYKIIISQTVYDYIVRDIAFLLVQRNLLAFFRNSMMS